MLAAIVDIMQRENNGIWYGSVIIYNYLLTRKQSFSTFCKKKSMHLLRINTFPHKMFFVLVKNWTSISPNCCRKTVNVCKDFLERLIIIKIVLMKLWGNNGLRWHCFYLSVRLMSRHRTKQKSGAPMRTIFDINDRHKHRFTEQKTLCLLVPKVKLCFVFVLVLC